MIEVGKNLELEFFSCRMKMNFHSFISTQKQWFWNKFNIHFA